MKVQKLQPSDKPDAGRQERIEALMKRCEELSGGQGLHWNADDCPPEMLESFLESIVAFEEASRSSLFEKLARHSCLTPAPESLSDRELPAKILEIAHALAAHGVFLERTDHLGDRELYEKLWSEILHDQYEDVPALGGFWMLDLAGCGTEEDILAHLRYYADEADRAEWQTEFPHFKLPEREERPYDRDRFLPSPPVA